MVPERDLRRWLSALSEATTLDEIAFTIADLGADAAGASFACLALHNPETDTVRLVYGAPLDPEIATRLAEFSLNPPTSLGDAIQTGAPIYLHSVEDIAARYPNMYDDARKASIVASASVPLRAATGAILGATLFGWPHAQAFKPSQRTQLELIARIAALALDRALLHQREQQRRHPTDPAPGTADTRRPHQLTRRQSEVLQLVAAGYTNAEIADLLGVSLRTIESTRSQLRQQLGVRTRAELVQHALDPNLIGPEP